MPDQCSEVPLTRPRRCSYCSGSSIATSGQGVMYSVLGTVTQGPTPVRGACLVQMDMHARCETFARLARAAVGG